ncbi:MAG TPA: tripartite tricarboxylate transporter TctB family protein, partial [Syntrophorhabdaceae bacterium]|nr:tripartite tricarboxylate transporter TctB family protein [Syntrophorhabdaceae bacterium]
MRALDRATAIFWIFFSAVVLVQSFRMGVGTLMNPGMGFMACGASGIMALLSIILLFKSFMGSDKPEERVHPFTGILHGRLIGFIISLVAYIFLLPSLGYLVATFLLLACLLLMVGKRKWWLLIIFPALSTLVSYYVFAK